MCALIFSFSLCMNCQVCHIIVELLFKTPCLCNKAPLQLCGAHEYILLIFYCSAAFSCLAWQKSLRKVVFQWWFVQIWSELKEVKLWPPCRCTPTDSISWVTLLEPSHFVLLKKMFGQAVQIEWELGMTLGHGCERQSQHVWLQSVGAMLV